MSVISIWEEKLVESQLAGSATLAESVCVGNARVEGLVRQVLSGSIPKLFKCGAAQAATQGFRRDFQFMS